MGEIAVFINEYVGSDFIINANRRGLTVKRNDISHTCEEFFKWNDIGFIFEKMHTSTNSGSTSPSEIADSMEAACFPEPGEFIMPRESWLKEWCRQLRTCR